MFDRLKGVLRGKGKDSVVSEKDLQKKAEKIKAESETQKMTEELKKYRKTIKSLRVDVEGLQQSVEKQKIEPKKALGGVKTIYRDMQSEKETVEKEIGQTKELMNYLEHDFLRRKINEDMFRKKMFEYREKLHVLSMEKKELLNQKNTLKKTAEQIAPVSLEEVSETSNLEKLLERQQQTLEKIASQRPTVIISGAGGKPLNSKQQAAFIQDALRGKASEKIEKLLQEKAKGTIDEKKLGEVEGKISELMEKYGVSEHEIEETISDTSTENLVQSINKLVNIIELDRKANQQLKQGERIETAMRFTQPMKKIEEIKGIATEVKKHRIVTDFDNILTIIVRDGRLKMGDIAKQTGIAGKRVEECCQLLEKENQIEIVYPAFGDPFVQTLDYRERAELEKLKKKKEAEQLKAIKERPKSDAEKQRETALAQKQAAENKDAKKTVEGPAAKDVKNPVEVQAPKDAKRPLFGRKEVKKQAETKIENGKNAKGTKGKGGKNG